ncbi:MAG: hypothetical protein RLZZ479_1571, partial [Bacteroidota bacterium]
MTSPIAVNKVTPPPSCYKQQATKKQPLHIAIDGPAGAG